MEQDDPKLTSGLQRLKIQLSAEQTEPQEASANPFMRRKRSKSLSNINKLFGAPCSCKTKHHHPRSTVKFKHNSTGKRKLLREPILKLLDHKRCRKGAKKKDVFGQCSRGGEQNFKSLIDGCLKLNLANVNDGVQDYGYVRQVRRKEDSAPESDGATGLSTTCSHQARMSVAPPCDVTIDELASYFETFVHIPKKMSSMAEMMYI